LSKRPGCGESLVPETRQPSESYGGKRGVRQKTENPIEQTSYRKNHGRGISTPQNPERINREEGVNSIKKKLLRGERQLSFSSNSWGSKAISKTGESTRNWKSGKGEMVLSGKGRKTPKEHFQGGQKRLSGKS